MVYTSAEGVKYDQWNNPTSAAQVSVKSYNPSTHTHTTLLNLSDTWISETNMLGNWILLVRTMPGGQNGVQLVRLDGQGLQTLYCSRDSPSAFIASPGARWLAFNVNNAVKLLDLTSGKLQTYVQAPPPGPRNSMQTGGSPMEWLDDTHLYIEKSGAGFGGMPGAGLYLLNTARGPNQSLSNLQLVRSENASPFVAPEDADLSPDRGTLFTGTCSTTFTSTGQNMGILSASGPSSVISSSPTGGKQKTIYTNQTLILTQIRVASSQAILFVGRKEKATDESLWRIGPDGSGMTQLVHVPQGQGISFKDGPHNRSSDFAPSGDLFALALTSESSSKGGTTTTWASSTGKTSSSLQKTQLAIGSVAGGSLTVFAPFSSSGAQFSIVGWGTV